MNLTAKFRRYRMTIPLAMGLLIPSVLGLAFGAAGIATEETIYAMSKVVVWSSGLWAFGAVDYELYAGWKRHQGSSTVDE